MYSCTPKRTNVLNLLISYCVGCYYILYILILLKDFTDDITMSSVQYYHHDVFFGVEIYPLISKVIVTLPNGGTSMSEIYLVNVVCNIMIIFVLLITVSL